ncbi:MAG: DUF2953 domain-containing protein [Eubacteriales bacterium]|jgi:predicted membrane protein
MNALKIFLIIILFFGVLLICPVTVKMRFENEFTATIRYLFFRYKIPSEREAPKKEEEKVGKEKAEEKKDTKSKIQEIIKQKGLSGFLSIISEFASVATGAAKKLFSHLTIQNISVEITVADEDAAQAAIHYGYTCSVVYTAMGILVANKNCRRYHINVVPDFNRKESSVLFQCKARIMLFSILTSLLPALMQSTKLYKAAKANPKISKNSTKKAVHEHE